MNKLTFKPGKTYRFGILTDKSRKSQGMPIYRTRPKPVSIKGETLLNNGIADFNEYLQKNPHNYPVDTTVTVCELGPENSLIILDESNPLPQNVKSQEENNSDLRDELPRQVTSHHYGGDMKFAIRELTKQMEYLQQENSMLGSRIQQMNDTLMNKEQQLAELKATMGRIEFERDTFKKALERDNEDKKSSGLGDLMSSPAMQSLIALGVQVAQAKMGGAMPPIQQAMGDNFDGKSTKPGEFDGSAL